MKVTCCLIETIFQQSTWAHVQLLAYALLLMAAKLNSCSLFCEPWSNDLILNLFIVWKRTLESTNLCMCCCRCSPEALLWLYLYVYLEALGVQEVQGAQGLQAHLLHLCTKHSVRTQPLPRQQETCTCPQDIPRTSLFLKRFKHRLWCNKLSEMLFVRRWARGSFTRSRTAMHFICLDYRPIGELKFQMLHCCNKHQLIFGWVEIGPSFSNRKTKLHWNKEQEEVNCMKAFWRGCNSHVPQLKGQAERFLWRLALQREQSPGHSNTHPSLCI